MCVTLIRASLAGCSWGQARDVRANKGNGKCFHSISYHIMRVRQPRKEETNNIWDTYGLTSHTLHRNQWGLTDLHFGFLLSEIELLVGYQFFC